MTGYELLAVVLLIGGLGPVALMGSAGRPENRLVALEMGGSISALFFLVFSQAVDLSYELVLSVVLVPLSLAGALVFTRLLTEKTK